MTPYSYDTGVEITTLYYTFIVHQRGLNIYNIIRKYTLQISLATRYKRMYNVCKRMHTNMTKKNVCVCVCLSTFGFDFNSH